VNRTQTIPDVPILPPIFAEVKSENVPQVEIERAETLSQPFSEDWLALKASATLAHDWKFGRERGWRHYKGDGSPVWESVSAPFDVCRTVCREEAQDQTLKPNERVRLSSAKTFAGVLRCVENDPRHHMKPEEWDSDPDVLMTPGGAIDLKTGESIPSARNRFCTMMTAVSPVMGKPKRWLEFLEWATASRIELQNDLQRACGYFSTGHTNEETLHFLYGVGGNGKSTFINSVSAILGTYAREASADVFLEQKFSQHPTALAGLQGARLVTATELAQGRVWNTSLLKHLTGGDKISARFMHQDFFEFKPNFKLVLSGNHRPALPSVDDAIRRRMLLVPFEQHISDSEKDTHLKETLRGEWPQILHWMLEGCAEWRKRGLAPSAEILGASSAYLNDEDSIGQWISECCQLGEGHEESSSALFDSWKQWAEGSKENAGSQKAFAQELSSRPGIKQYRTARVRGFKGIVLLANMSRQKGSDE
jgi:putative DNA primase/helicase